MGLVESGAGGRQRVRVARTAAEGAPAERAVVHVHVKSLRIRALLHMRGFGIREASTNRFGLLGNPEATRSTGRREKAWPRGGGVPLSPPSSTFAWQTG